MLRQLPRYPAKPWVNRPAKRPAVLPKAPGLAQAGGRPSNPDTRDKVYRAIVAYAGEHGGNTPTRRELCELTEISSTSVVSWHIAKLIASDLLEIIDRKLIVVGGQWTPPERTQENVTAGTKAHV